MDRLTHWWEDPAWGRDKAMVFPDRRDGKRVRVLDPKGHFARKDGGGYVWVPEHPHHRASLIYTGR